MMKLQEQILDALVKGTSKDLGTLAPADVLSFFESSKENTKNLLTETNVQLENAKRKLTTLENTIINPDKNPTTLVERILCDLHDELECANLAFQHKKQVKQTELAKELKLAVVRKDFSLVIKCLFDIDRLQTATKDLRVSEVQEKIRKYSEMANEEGKQYLSIYTLQEEKDVVKQQVEYLESEAQALETILN